MGFGHRPCLTKHHNIESVQGRYAWGLTQSWGSYAVTVTELQNAEAYSCGAKLQLRFAAFARYACAMHDMHVLVCYIVQWHMDWGMPVRVFKGNIMTTDLLQTIPLIPNHEL